MFYPLAQITYAGPELPFEIGQLSKNQNSPVAGAAAGIHTLIESEKQPCPANLPAT
jgi:hypothetical protein